MDHFLTMMVDPALDRFDHKKFKNECCIAVNQDVEVFYRALEMLSETEYGSLKYFQLSDASAAGAREWRCCRRKAWRRKTGRRKAWSRTGHEA